MTASDGVKNIHVTDDLNQIIFRGTADSSDSAVLGRYMVCEQFVTILQMYVQA